MNILKKLYTNQRMRRKKVNGIVTTCGGMMDEWWWCIGEQKTSGNRQWHVDQRTKVKLMVKEDNMIKRDRKCNEVEQYMMELNAQEPGSLFIILGKIKINPWQ